MVLKISVMILDKIGMIMEGIFKVIDIILVNFSDEKIVL